MNKFNRLAKLSLSVIFFLNIGLTSFTLQANTSGIKEKNIDSIISSWTLEERAQLLIGTGMFFPMPDSIRDMMPAGIGGRGGQPELVALGKTKLLNQGVSETLKFTVTSDKLASFNENTSAWIVEQGQYRIKVGASALHIKESAKFTVEIKFLQVW